LRYFIGYDYVGWAMTDFDIPDVELLSEYNAPPILS